MKADRAMKPVEALNRIADIVTAFGISQVFYTSCKLKVFDQLAQGPTTAENLASRLHIHPVGCRRLLAALVDIGLVVSEGGLYRNSELGGFCTSASSVRLAALSALEQPWS
jgi:predicted transcriptional regulator